MDTITRVIEIKTSQDAVDTATWKYFRELLEYLSIGGMSSKEEGTGNVHGRTAPVFLVRLCVWRAPEISSYLECIDRAAENPAICGSKRSRALPRIPVEEESRSGVPKELPRKMYNQEWLATQEKEQLYYVREELRVSEEAFELLVLVSDA